MKNSEIVIKELHKRLIVILDEIDRICRKHNINYFLDSGTALGAIRHGGFIPWDDDADVGMVRQEYEKFLEVAPRELGKDFFLQTRKTDQGYEKYSAKVRLNNTYFPEPRNESMSIHQGIFVDIFPFDFINDDRNKAIKDIKVARKLKKITAIRERRPQHEAIHRKIIRGVSSIIPQKSLEKACLRHFTKYNAGTSNTLVSYTYKMTTNNILLFKYTDIYPSVDIEFEDRKYMIMNNYDAYLKTMYGNYMELPPEDKRVWHFDGEIKYE